MELQVQALHHQRGTHVILESSKELHPKGEMGLDPRKFLQRQMNVEIHKILFGFR